VKINNLNDISLSEGTIEQLDDVRRYGVMHDIGLDFVIRITKTTKSNVPNAKGLS